MPPSDPRHEPYKSSDATAEPGQDKQQPVRLAAYIQSTLISNAITSEVWERHVDNCLLYGFHAAMVPPAWVGRTREKLHGSCIKVASFIDFPLGTMTSAGKADETRHLLQAGVQEIDLMPNVGFLLSGLEKEYAADIRGVVEAAGSVPVKIMLELPLLNPARRERALAISLDAGVAYLKNASSGSVGIATVEQIRYLRAAAPAGIGVKASGGIKTARQVRDLLLAGADLVGTSCALSIVGEEQAAPATGSP